MLLNYCSVTIEENEFYIHFDDMYMWESQNLEITLSDQSTDSSSMFVTESRILAISVPGSNDQTSVTPGPAILKICLTFIYVKFSRRQKTMYFLRFMRTVLFI